MRKVAVGGTLSGLTKRNVAATEERLTQHRSVGYKIVLGFVTNCEAHTQLIPRAKMLIVYRQFYYVYKYVFNVRRIYSI